MTLEKLTIEYETGQTQADRATITALFNPNQLSYSWTVGWKPIDPAVPLKSGNYRSMEFTASDPETLTVNLFFDTYESSSSSATTPGFGALSGASSRPTSVVPLVEQVMQLAEIVPDLHRPPVCRLRWGKNKVFKGVVVSLNRNYVLFLADGTPVRATVDCTFSDARIEQAEMHSADVAKVYTVRPGDTLMAIASAFYNDASQWRAIATANDIFNPRKLVPGAVLTIPSLT